MLCHVCKEFPVPTSKFEELGVSIERHGTLFRCKECGRYFEMIAEERSPRFTPEHELRKCYPDAFS